jgi:hypothetical protein
MCESVVRFGQGCGKQSANFGTKCYVFAWGGDRRRGVPQNSGSRASGTFSGIMGIALRLRSGSEGALLTPPQPRRPSESLRKRLLQRPHRRAPVGPPVRPLRVIHDRQLRRLELRLRHRQPLVQLRMLLLPIRERRAPDPERQRRLRIRHPAPSDRLAKHPHSLFRIPGGPPLRLRRNRRDNIGGRGVGSDRSLHARDCSMPLSHLFSQAGSTVEPVGFKTCILGHISRFPPFEGPRKP